jgi:hypothetical protein
MSTHLLEVLVLGVHDHLGYKSEKDIFHELSVEGEFGPVVTLLENVKNIP